MPAEWRPAGRGRAITATSLAPKHLVIAQNGLARSYVSPHGSFELNMNARPDLGWKVAA